MRIPKTDIAGVRKTTAYAWADRVANGGGERPQCEFVRLAAQRFLNDLKRDDIYFDLKEYSRLVRYYGIFKHTKGLLRGKQFLLRPDQEFFLGQIIAWKYRESGERRIRETYKEVAKKNGKSWEAGGMAGYFLTAFGESEAEVYSLATSEKQAGESWRAFKSMSKTNSVYRNALEYRLDEIRHPKSGSIFQPLPSTGDLLDGKNASFILADEYHLFKPRDDMSLSSLVSGSVAREYSLTFKITTAGWNTFGSCYDERKRAESILKGTVNLDSYLPLIFTLDKDDDWQDERNWFKANPALGLSKSLSAMRLEYEKAVINPRLLNNFKNKQLDLWTNAADNWLSVDQWRKCEKRYSLEELRGKQCFVGMDLSDRRDLTALVLLFPQQEGLVKPHILPYLYVPAVSAIKRETQDKVPYLAWSERGFVKLEDEGYINKKMIFEKIMTLAKIFDVMCVAYDPWHAADIAESLQSEGVNTLAIRQGFKTLSPACKQIEEWVNEESFTHNGNEAMTWCAGNVVLRKDENNNICPDKRRSTERIDGLAALANAVVAMQSRVEEKKIITECPIRIF